jgi:peptide/nickel transport system permease protein
VVGSSSEGYTRTVTAGETMTEEVVTFTFDYEADEFPPEITMFVDSTFQEKAPFVSMTWITPDGREIRLGDVTPTRSTSFRIGQEKNLKRRLGGVAPEQGLFADPNADPPEPLKGTYQVRLETTHFEEASAVDPRLVVYGAVHGFAGTDHLRRDLMIALLWGTPVAMSFGLIAAAGTTITTMSIAAISVWYGGAVDSTIQRITEVNMILPLLPILIMIGAFYSRSIWVMLGVVILFSIFGAAIKSYRAIFLQVSTLPYIEAARAYGASNRRIIFRYLVPRVLPLVIPNLVILVPAFVFLEASLAVLGLGDPVLPTWGKVIQNANTQGALFNGYYYWILEPAVLLMFAGLAFAMVGFALDRVFNPRLREL